MPERRRGRLGDRVVEILELPREVVFHAPRLVLIGNLHLSVENHRGVVEFGSDRLVVGVGEGQVAVEGDDLTIVRIGREEMAVTGRIRCLRFS
ncbi:MAG: sporulation protein YqfC [Bacillota bacterium]|nr:sporulation protein YqfC [Bacillota bacterium]